MSLPNSNSLTVGRIHRHRRTQIRSVVIDIGRYARSLRRLPQVQFLRVGHMDEETSIELLEDISDQFQFALDEARRLLTPAQNDRLI